MQTVDLDPLLKLELAVIRSHRANTLPVLRLFREPKGYPRLSDSVGLYAQVVDTREGAGMTVEIDLAAAL